jgi:predicted ATPase
MTRKFVFTGGQCSGKTETFFILSKRGYHVVPESAKYLIEKEEKEGGNIFPWTNLEEFQKRVAKLQSEWEDGVPSDTPLAFFERSMMDCLAYCRRHGLEIPPELDGYRPDYEAAFFLEMLPENPYWYRTRSGKPRMTSYEEARKMAEAIRKVYEEHGIKIIDIRAGSPPMPAEERVTIIESHVRKLAAEV